ncbi:hypothetical protein KGP26_30055 (plasmid) [Serratia sp. JSRIV002]|uniref:hypothetical protein n=1 Tax=Serratia sp. JSRIV002 TaxID=2831894 RepID=UPI001CBAF106|nr:hypothetical protein [Serratia sp. JSRIV002]UAN54702.1 hypothetical protein KGP26_30055 [Serratia sp. JSRIV002]
MKNKDEYNAYQELIKDMPPTEPQVTTAQERQDHQDRLDREWKRKTYRNNCIGLCILFCLIVIAVVNV